MAAKKKSKQKAKDPKPTLPARKLSKAPGPPPEVSPPAAPRLAESKPEPVSPPVVGIGASVNNQLRERVHELEKTNNDIANLLNNTDIATVFLDAAFRIRLFTQAANQLFNFAAADLGRPLGDITARFSDPDLLSDAQQVLQRLTPREKEVSTAAGGWWLRRITPYRTRDNRVEGVVLTFTEVTPVKKADEQARLLATMLKDSNDAVIVHDFDGRILAWNHGAERLYGYAEVEAMTMNAQTLLPEGARAQKHALWERLRKGEQIDSWEARRLTKDGRVRDVWVTVTTLKDNNRPVAIAKTERDITERKRVETSLREKEERLRLALNAGDMGTWFWDFGADTVAWDARQFELFGIAPEEFDGGSAQILAQVHAEDRPRLDAALARTQEHGAPFREEFRVQRPDGSYRWLIGLAQLLTDA